MIEEPTATSADLGTVSGELVDWKALIPARQRAGLSAWELYVRYVALGGSVSSELLSDHLATGAALSNADHDLAVLALNERFMEIDALDRLPYHQGQQ